jgi:hypothetical protein
MSQHTNHNNWQQLVVFYKKKKIQRMLKKTFFVTNFIWHLTYQCVLQSSRLFGKHFSIHFYELQLNLEWKFNSQTPGTMTSSCSLKCDVMFRNKQAFVILSDQHLLTQAIHIFLPYINLECHKWMLTYWHTPTPAPLQALINANCFLSSNLHSQAATLQSNVYCSIHVQ